jgi:S1-C subfamily serine protease
MFYNDPMQPNQQPSSGYPSGAVPGAAPQFPPASAQGMQATPWSSQYPWPTPTPQQKPGRSGIKSGAIFALTCVIVLIFGVGLFSGWEFASSQVANSASSPSTSKVSTSGSNTTLAETQQEAVIAGVLPAVVEIRGTISQGETIGSGIIIDSKGDIVTNNHVVSGSVSLQVVLSNGNIEQAQVVGTDPAADLAVVHIQPFTGMVVATLGDSSQLTLGEEVLAIGNPLGYTETVTEGVVSALNRTVSESNSVNLTGLVQISAAINPGNSGGALIDLRGQVVGMPTLSAVNTETNTPANGVGFAISSNQIKTAVEQIVVNYSNS